MTPLDFSTLSNAQINAAIAEAEGLVECNEGAWRPMNPYTMMKSGDCSHAKCFAPGCCPHYVENADECVKLLGKSVWVCDHNKEGFYVITVYQGGRMFGGEESTFPRAALLAWGRAKGIFV